jgi:DUF971 family protein
VSNIDIVPVSIQRDGDAGITITWSDESVSKWSCGQLRKACPCATCREQRRGESEQADSQKKPAMLPVLSAAEAQPLKIESMRPVGNYAYSIAFSDGHSSGVFLFDLLRNPKASL